MSYTLLSQPSAVASQALAPGVYFARYGKLCIVSIWYQATLAKWSNTQIATLPSDAIPAMTCTGCIESVPAHDLWIQATTEGTVLIGSNSTAITDQYVWGQVVYVAS